ncbi:MAG: ABC transporter ATP-binding protein [Marinibacterium sp.]
MSHLVLDQVSKTFRSDGREVQAVTPVSLDIAKGQIVTFLGPSGCGKTTLMRMVGGLETPTAGRITLDDTVLQGPDRRRGMVFQSYSAFPWLTVAGNIRMGLKYRPGIPATERDRLVSDLIALVGLTGFDDSFTNRISGGMRQRVAIARTLAADPDVLLMDEPFGALDALTREHLQTKLMDLNRRAAKTTIFVTHDVEEAILIANRLIVFSARPARLLEDLDIDARLGKSRNQALRDTADFLDLRRHVQKVIRAEYSRAERETARV